MVSERLIDSLMPGLPKAGMRMMLVPYYVGQFVMTWAKHERMLAGTLARIQEVDYAPLRDRLLDQQIKAYEGEIIKTIDHLGENHIATTYLRKILYEHIDLRDFRHDIVHGFWLGIGPDDEYVLKRKPRGQEEAARTIELDELIDAYRRLDQLGVTVINAHRTFEGKELLEPATPLPRTLP